jgi:carbon storage regulator
MLLLSRSIGESIRIGNDIEVKVVSVKGAQVRLGIEAPRTVSVHRHEIFERIQRGEENPNPNRK